VVPAAAAARLAGQVVDGRAHAVPEARVLAFRTVQADAGAGTVEPARATTDLDGRFAIERLAAGSYRLLVEAAGFPTAEASPVTAPAAELVLHVAGEGRAIFGRVELDGAPAAGARVALAGELGGPVRQTSTRADGRFAFSGLGDGTYALRASRAELASPTIRGVAAGSDGATLSTLLALGPGQSIAGRLVQDAGAALAGFEVRAESAALAPGDDPLPVLARTDETGAFTVGPLSPGSYRLTSARAGYVLRHAPTVELRAAAGQPPPVVLELLRGSRITGRVTDARGAPAASAHVRCVASAMDDLTVHRRRSHPGPLPGRGGARGVRADADR
jgi:hypothetical protein